MNGFTIYFVVLSALISNLGSPKFKQRGAATSSLIVLTNEYDFVPILKACRKTSKDCEVRNRIDRVLTQYYNPMPTVPGFEDKYPLITAIQLKGDPDWEERMDQCFATTYIIKDTGKYKIDRVLQLDNEALREHTMKMIHYKISKPGASRKKIILLLNRMAEGERANKSFKPNNQDKESDYPDGADGEIP